jgi:hypothetical protein
MFASNKKPAIKIAIAEARARKSLRPGIGSFG